MPQTAPNLPPPPPPHALKGQPPPSVAKIDAKSSSAREEDAYDPEGGNGFEIDFGDDDGFGLTAASDQPGALAGHNNVNTASSYDSYQNQKSYDYSPQYAASQQQPFGSSSDLYQSSQPVHTGNSTDYTSSFQNGDGAEVNGAAGGYSLEGGPQEYHADSYQNEYGSSLEGQGDQYHQQSQYADSYNNNYAGSSLEGGATDQYEGNTYSAGSNYNDSYNASYSNTQSFGGAEGGLPEPPKPPTFAGSPERFAAQLSSPTVAVEGATALALDYETPAFPAHHGARRRSSSSHSHVSNKSGKNVIDHPVVRQMPPQSRGVSELSIGSQWSHQSGQSSNHPMTPHSLQPVKEVATGPNTPKLASGYFMPPPVGSVPQIITSYTDPYNTPLTPKPTYDSIIPTGHPDVVESERTEDSLTTLAATFHWVVQNFSSLTDEKIVSPPFGARDWLWQIVLYPRGPTAESEHLSAFLRPLRSLKEIQDGGEWFRPVNKFTIRIHKPPNGGVSGIDYIPSRAPTPVDGASSINGGGVYDDATVLVQDTSLETFNEFSASVPGWGFSTLLPLDALHSSAIDAVDGSLTLSACVDADIAVPWVTRSVSWKVPRSFWEDVTGPAGDGSNQVLLKSPEFGPKGKKWTVQLQVDSDENGVFVVMGHLLPVLSENERANAEGWSRSVSSFTLKLYAGLNALDFHREGAAFEAPLVAKTLTGGFTFNSKSLMTGWPQLCDFDVLLEAVAGGGGVRVDVEVTCSENTEANVGAAMREAQGLNEKLDAMQKESLAWAQEVGHWKSLAETSDNKARQEIERARAIAKELERARSEVAKFADMELKVVGARARLSEVRANMEDMKNTAADSTDAEAFNEEKFIQVRAKLHAALAELADVKEHLRLKTLEKVDAGLGVNPAYSHRRMSYVSNHPGPVAPAGNASEEQSDELVPLAQAMAMVRAELNAARLALAEAGTKTPGGETPAGPAAEAERAAVRADVAMVHAELEVARASLIDSACHPLHAKELQRDKELAAEFTDLRSEIQEIISKLENLRASLRVDTYWFEDPLHQPIAAQKETKVAAGLPPPPPSIFANSPRQESSSSIVTPKRPGQPPPPPPSSLPPLPVTKAEDDKEKESLKKELESVKSKLRVAREMLLAEGFTGELPELTPLRMSIAHDQRPSVSSFQLVPEPWTPVEASSEGVSVQELKRLLASVESQRRSSGGGLTSFVFTLFLVVASSFIATSTMQYHCSDPANNSSALCTTAVPAYESLTTAWHSAAEHFAVNVMPQAIEGISSGTEMVVTGFQGGMKAFQEWQERQRLEREKREQEEQIERERLEAETRAARQRMEMEAKKEAERLFQQREAERKAERLLLEEQRRQREEDERRDRIAAAAAARAKWEQEEQAAKLKETQEQEEVVRAAEAKIAEAAALAAQAEAEEAVETALAAQKEEAAAAEQQRIVDAEKQAAELKLQEQKLEEEKQKKAEQEETKLRIERDLAAQLEKARQQMASPASVDSTPSLEPTTVVAAATPSSPVDESTKSSSSSAPLSKATESMKEAIKQMVTNAGSENTENAEPALPDDFVQGEPQIDEGEAV